MKEKNRAYRDSAKFAVFSHLGASIMAVILSGLMETLVMSYYMANAEQKGINIFEMNPSNIEILKVTLIVALLATIVNMPLSFCATRFYLLISRKGIAERATMKEFFAPFTDVGTIIKGTLVMLLTLLINALGVYVLVFPVYLSYCMAVFVMHDDPQVSPIKAMTLSRRMMKGHKWHTFCTVIPLLLLNFALTYLMSSLILFSFLITSIVQSVYFVTLAVIYNDLKISTQKDDTENEKVA